MGVEWFAHLISRSWVSTLEVLTVNSLGVQLAWIVVRGAPSYAGNESLHGHKLQDCDVGNAFQCMKALGRALRKHRHKKKTTG
eukprot:1159667-Pelagomonas_calceolata.AAC.1